MKSKKWARVRKKTLKMRGTRETCEASVMGIDKRTV